MKTVIELISKCTEVTTLLLSFYKVQDTSMFLTVEGPVLQ